MKLNWNFQRGGGVLEKIPSVGEVWIFSGITHPKIKQKHYYSMIYSPASLVDLLAQFLVVCSLDPQL